MEEYRLSQIYNMIVMIGVKVRKRSRIFFFNVTFSVKGLAVEVGIMDSVTSIQASLKLHHVGV